MGEALPLVPGRSVDSIVDGGGDPIFGRALALQMLASELEGAIEEFKYDDPEREPLSADLVTRCRRLLDWIESLSLNGECQLTPDRICGTCDGRADDCEHCEGTGIEPHVGGAEGA